jgi:NAD(P)-dependent dehydrogenase (short-subunit alcohol dehydrogenase family)
LDKLQDLPKTDALRLLQLDITAGEEAIRDIVAAAVGFWGGIDVLMNNAGYGSKALVEEGG